MVFLSLGWNVLFNILSCYTHDNTWDGKKARKKERKKERQTPEANEKMKMNVHVYKVQESPQWTQYGTFMETFGLLNP